MSHATAVMHRTELPVPAVEAGSRANVAHISALLLGAWKQGDDESFQAELRRAQLLSTQAHGLDALETERMEVLESIVESLDGQRRPSCSGPVSSERMRAAVRLLEHLATGWAVSAQE